MARQGFEGGGRASQHRGGARSCTTVHGPILTAIVAQASSRADDKRSLTRLIHPREGEPQIAAGIVVGGRAGAGAQRSEVKGHAPAVTWPMTDRATRGRPKARAEATEGIADDDEEERRKGERREEGRGLVL